MSRRVVVWFRNDLRVRDNHLLARAADLVEAGQADEVVPLYCFDPKLYGTTRWGSAKTGRFRAQFVVEAVGDLKAGLRASGSDLVVAMGAPEDAIPALCGPGCTVLVQEEVAYEEEAVEAAVEAAARKVGARMERLWGSCSLYHREDLPFDDALRGMPEGFTSFKNKVEARCQVRAELPPPRHGSLPFPRAALHPDMTEFVPSLLDIGVSEAEAAAAARTDPRSVMAFRGGEGAAGERLRHYLDSGAVKSYFDTRNQMLGADGSTKLSPWLALGCISPVTIYHAIKAYEAKQGANKSTYWVQFELTWRDYFRFFFIKHGRKMFLMDGPGGRAYKWRRDPDRIARWKAGCTGYPLVDACMREMAATGWMSNRGRQNVASYLCMDLDVDWRIGADHFESVLLDYDVYSNWGNWAVAADVVGGRRNVFNISKQARDYDLRGDYVRHWLPELRGVSPRHIIEPWRMTEADQREARCVLGRDYPHPGKPFCVPGGGAGAAAGGARGGAPAAAAAAARAALIRPGPGNSLPTPPPPPQQQQQQQPPSAPAQRARPRSRPPGGGPSPIILDLTKGAYAGAEGAGGGSSLGGGRTRGGGRKEVIDLTRLGR